MKYTCKVIAFRPEWVEIFGDRECALFYQQALYWSQRCDGGEFYKSTREFEFETTLSEKEQRRVIKKLVSLGYISCEMKQAPDNRKTRHFRVLINLVLEGTPSRREGVPLPEGKGTGARKEPVIYTENTTEITTEIKDRESPFKNDIEEILEQINTRTGSKFTYKGHAKYIEPRLKEGNSKWALKTVVDKKCEDWLKSDEMKAYIRPSTLFRPRNFDNYINECRAKNLPLDEAGRRKFGLEMSEAYKRLMKIMEEEKKGKK